MHNQILLVIVSVALNWWLFVELDRQRRKHQKEMADMIKRHDMISKCLFKCDNELRELQGKPPLPPAPPHCGWEVR